MPATYEQPLHRKGGIAVTVQGGELNLRDIYGYDCYINSNDHELIILPSYFHEGLPIYSSSIDTLVEDLRDSGIDAAYLHDAEHQLWRVTESAGQVALSFVVGIASNAAWNLLIMWLRRRKDSQVEATVLDMRRDSQGTNLRYRRFNGSGSDVVDALSLYEKHQDADDES
jgi:hypothetical protein